MHFGVVEVGRCVSGVSDVLVRGAFRNRINCAVTAGFYMAEPGS